MDKTAWRSTLPYVVGLAVAALLFYYARQIEYTPRGNSLGPDFWPKTALGLMTVACLVGIVRGLFGMKSDARGIGDALEQAQQEGEEEDKAKTYPWLLAGGVALITCYALVVGTLGFLLSTFFFLAIFMYLGRYRRHLAIWLTSAGVTFAAAVLFMRIAYVSLPRGIPPFDKITDVVRTLLGG